MKLKKKNQLNNIIVEAFNRSGMKQQELAQKIGKCPTLISKIIHGNYSPGAKTIMLLCKELNLDDVKLLKISAGVDKYNSDVKRSADENFIINKYRSLSKEKKYMLLAMLQGV